MEVFGKPDHIALWQAAGDGKSVDWETVFDGYHSAVDWPVCYFWKELIELYPDAKVLLTIRDAEAWFKSANATIFKAMTLSMGNSEDPHRNMAKTIVVDNTFGGDLTDKKNAIDVYEKHNREVIDTVAADRLLVFESSQGWKPLCDFLEVPVPDTGYPQSNSTDDFAQRVKAAIAAS